MRSYNFSICVCRSRTMAYRLGTRLSVSLNLLLLVLLILVSLVLSYNLFKKKGKMDDQSIFPTMFPSWSPCYVLCSVSLPFTVWISYYYYYLFHVSVALCFHVKLLIQLLLPVYTLSAALHTVVFTLYSRSCCSLFHIAWNLFAPRDKQHSFHLSSFPSVICMLCKICYFVSSCADNLCHCPFPVTL